MPNPVVLGTPATCAHVATATSTVFVGGLPVSKVGIDVAGGLIVGPGSAPFSVFVEGIPMSLVGDFISPHGDGAHTAASFPFPLPNAISVNIGL